MEIKQWCAVNYIFQRKWSVFFLMHANIYSLLYNTGFKSSRNCINVALYYYQIEGPINVMVQTEDNYPENGCSTTDKCHSLIATCLGRYSLGKHRLIGIGVTIIRLRLSAGRLRWLMMGIPISIRRRLLREKKPCIVQNGRGLEIPRNSTGHG